MLSAENVTKIGTIVTKSLVLVAMDSWLPRRRLFPAAAPTGPSERPFPCPPPPPEPPPRPPPALPPPRADLFIIFLISVNFVELVMASELEVELEEELDETDVEPELEETYLEPELVILNGVEL